MQIFTFAILSVFLLMPIQQFQNCGPQGISCDYAPSLDPRKKSDQTENDLSSSYCKKGDPVDPFQEGEEPLVVNVHYEPTKLEKSKPYDTKKAFEQDNVKCDDFEPDRESGVKFHYQGFDRESSTPGSEKSDISCARRKNVMSAECEQCELQVKASGDGVILRCRDCREVSNSEIAFPPGSHRKVVRLP